MTKIPTPVLRESQRWYVLLGWLAVHGIDINEVPEDASVEINDKTLTVEVVLKGSDGKVVYDADRNTVRRTTQSVPLKFDPPNLIMVAS